MEHTTDRAPQQQATAGSGTIGDMTVQISRGERRFTERVPGRLTRHAFSFGSDYDPDRVAFGPLVCHDDHLLGSGQGFDEHHHEGLEIVTWVVSGRVRHRDGLGNETVLGPDDCGIFSTGSGVDHAEHATADGPARFVQTWVAAEGDAPAYRHLSTAPGLEPVRLYEAPGTSYDVVRLAANETHLVPAAPKVHVFVATGALLRSSLAEPLQAGDAFLLTDEPDHKVSAGVPTDLLIWSFS